MPDALLFWLVDKYDQLRTRVTRWLIADDQTSAYCARVDDELDLHEEIQQILKSQTGRSN